MVEILFKYARQPSTWRGIALLASGFGYAVSPELLNEIVTFTTAAFGVIEVMRNEHKDTP